MKEKMIRTLMVEPNKHPCIKVLENNLDSLQKAVSIGAEYQGYIEAVHLKDGVMLLCNEEAKLLKLQGNRMVNGDLIAGIFYLVSTDEEGNFASLTTEEIKEYAQEFWYPEYYTAKDVEDAIFVSFEFH